MSHLENILEHLRGNMLDTIFVVPEWDMTKYEVKRTKEYSNRWLKLLRLDRFITWKTVELPSVYREKVTVDFFIPREDRIRKPVKIVVVFQILGGTDIVSRIFAHYFAYKGYPSIVVHRSKELFKLKFITDTGINLDLETTLKELNENIKNVGIIHRQAIDFALWYLPEESDLRQVDTEGVYAIGVSLGGITLSGISAVEEKIEKVLIALAGGDVADVLTSSKENSVKRNIDRLCKHYKISRDDLKAELRKHLTYGNSKMLYTQGAKMGYIPSWKYRMFVTLFDRDVPTRTQHQLRRLLNCKTLYLPTGHYTAVIFFPFILWYTRRFFERA